MCMQRLIKFKAAEMLLTVKSYRHQVGTVELLVQS